MIINQVIKGGGSTSLTVQLNPVASGVNVYAVGGGETSTAVSDSEGMAIVYVKPDTTYTVSADGEYPDKTVAVAKAPIIVELKILSKYACFEIDTTNSDPLTSVSYPQKVTIGGVQYDNSCYGFTKANGTGANCLGSDWASHWLVSKIKPVVSDGASTPSFTDAPKNPENWITGSEYFTQFDACWYCIETDGNIIRGIIANTVENPDSNRFTKDAFLGADGTTIRNCFHYGCFDSSGSTSGIYSKASNTLLANQTIVQFCQGANARGSEYDIASFQQLTYIQLVFIMIYGSLDSQTAHSKGLTSGSEHTTNTPLSCSNDFGMAGSTSDATARTAFFWIHDLWGTAFQYIGGLFVRAGSVRTLYILKSRMAQSSSFDNSAWFNPTQAKQSNIGESTGKTSASSGKYMKTVCGTNLGGFAPMDSSGSSSTYFSDYGWVRVQSSNATFPRVGGAYITKTNAGLFYCNISDNSTSYGPDAGSRLSYRGGTS